MRSILAAAALTPFLIVLTVLAVMTAGPAFSASLSANAELILTTARQGTDLNAICDDRSRLTAELKSVTRGLMQSGKLSGNPRSDAQAAGKYITSNCGTL